MDQINKNTASFMLGASAGLLAMALLSPKSGKQFRKHIRDTFGNVKKPVAEKVENIESQIIEARDNAVDRLNTANMTEEGLTE